MKNQNETPKKPEIIDISAEIIRESGFEEWVANRIRLNRWKLQEKEGEKK